MTVVSLEPQPLTADNFAPFGQVIEVDHHDPIIINSGNTERYDALGRVEICGAQGYAVLNIFRAQPRQLPLRITMVERHPLGSQSFQPLSGEHYLVLVADSVERPNPEQLQVFFAHARQGVNYKPNIWHHPLLALNKVCDFLVVDRKGEGENCEEYYFDETLEIMINMPRFEE